MRAYMWKKNNSVSLSCCSGGRLVACHAVVEAAFVAHAYNFKQTTAKRRPRYSVTLRVCLFAHANNTVPVLSSIYSVTTIMCVFKGSFWQNGWPDCAQTFHESRILWSIFSVKNLFSSMGCG